MAADSLEQRIAHIDAYAKALLQGIRVMDERRYILEPLLKDEKVKAALSAKFNDTHGAHAYNHLAPLLAQDLIRDLFRLFLDEQPRG